MNEPQIIDIYTYNDQRGSLGVVESMDLPFEIKRIYYLFNVPDNTMRGVHAHKKLQQLMICFGGSVDIKLHNGKKEFSFTLDSPDKALYVPPMHWRELSNFSKGSSVVVLASMNYSKEDYIFNKTEFINLKNEI